MDEWSSGIEVGMGSPFGKRMALWWVFPMCLGYFFSLDQIQKITRKGGDLEGKRTNREIYWDISWNTQGNNDLYMGSKGFFTIIFFNQEDRNQILEGGLFFIFSRPLPAAMEINI